MRNSLFCIAKVISEKTTHGRDPEPKQDRQKSMSVVIFCLKNRHRTVISDIYQSVDVIYTSRPGTSQCMLQRFRFSDAFERIVAEHILNEQVNTFECFAVLGLPVDIVFPSTGSPG